MFVRTLFLFVWLLASWGTWPAPAAPARPAPQECVNVIITSPRDNAVLRGNVEILGSASIPEFQFYKVEFSPTGANQWTVFTHIYRQPVINGRLDVWNTTTVPDGLYDLRLTAVNIRAQEVCYAFARQLLVANTTPPTNTPVPTPMPTPTRPVTPTAPILVQQPPTATPLPLPTLAPVAVPTRPPSLIPDTQEILDVFNVRRLAESFLLGVGTTTAVFTLVGLIALIRRLL